MKSLTFSSSLSGKRSRSAFKVREVKAKIKAEILFVQVHLFPRERLNFITDSFRLSMRHCRVDFNLRNFPKPNKRQFCIWEIFIMKFYTLQRKSWRTIVIKSDRFYCNASFTVKPYDSFAAASDSFPLQPETSPRGTPALPIGHGADRRAFPTENLNTFKQDRIRECPHTVIMAITYMKKVKTSGRTWKVGLTSLGTPFS